MDILFASSNKHKIKEITQLLPKGHHLLGLQDIGITEEIPEPGSTIKENSLLKTQFIVEYLKRKNNTMAVFADDSGLEVEALGNAPGVYSARYAGTPKNETANNEKLLKELNGIENRNARFVTVITLHINEKILYFEGIVNGRILQSPIGKNGFGYDPLFVPDGFNETFAQLSSESKNKISHRGRAVQKLVSFLEQLK
jgi:XTP/dITP diphosphohydrolase